MKKFYYAIALLLLWFQVGYGQCPNVDVLVFNYQNEVDNFITAYPNCTAFGGSIEIRPFGFDVSDISNLDGLQNLQSIGEYLEIKNNHYLSDLVSLTNLNSVGGFLELKNNSILLNLDGLNNLSSIGGGLIITNQNALPNLAGLNNLSSVGGNLAISSNDNLENFVGLENLITVSGDLLISDNPILVEISQLDNVQSLMGLRITSNPNLSSLMGLHNISGAVGDLRITDNASLESLAPLAGITGAEDLYVTENPNLVNLNGLNNLQFVNDYISIGENENLTSFEGLENLAIISGHFDIEENENLSSIAALSNVQSIGGGMYIFANPNLENLDGLHNLDSIHLSLHITANFSLNSFEALGNLTYIGMDLNLNSNLNLTSLTGLQNLNEIGGGVKLYYLPNLSSLAVLSNLSVINEHLEIVAVDALTDLNGLQNLTSVGSYFSIRENDILSSLSALQNLSSIGGMVTITDNPQLSFCSIPPICNYIVNGAGNITIDNNATDCATIDEVVFICEQLGKVTIYCYYDLNENAVFETNEPLIPSTSANISPGDYTVFCNATNGGFKYLGFGEYDLSYNQNAFPDWSLTSPISSYSISIDSGNESDTIYFGLTPNSLSTGLYATCANTAPRCNEFVTLDVIAVNNGTTTANGILWFPVDENILDVNFIDIPDTTDTSGRYGWFFSNLFPLQIIKKQISLQFPGPPDFTPGDLLDFEIEVQYSDELTALVSINYLHSIAVLCAYDPNDKLVQPVNPGNYALNAEDLIYTIRFQNTGNAEAYDVVLKDTLDSNLDINTFRYLASSHEAVLSTFLIDNILTFEFVDILLPDSTTNFDASQGYVMYSIRANNSIAEYSEIQNTASIYFDFNPAVVTNTTSNIIVSTFDADGDNFLIWDDCDDNNPLLNPDVLEIPYNTLDDDCNELTPDDDLDGDGFLLADDCDDNNPLLNPNATDIPNNGIDEDCDGNDLISSTTDLKPLAPQVYPNPTSGILHIVFPILQEGNCQLRDFSGKLIVECQIGRETFLDLSELAQGVYVLVLKTGEGLWMERVVRM